MTKIDEAFERLSRNLNAQDQARLNERMESSEAASRLTALAMHHAVMMGRADVISPEGQLHSLVAKFAVVCSMPFGVEFLGGSDGFIAAITEALEACPRVVPK
jgi:hypothetical protein